MVNPDCSLSGHEAAEVFYLKQVVYALVPPVIMILSYIFWHSVACIKKSKSRKHSSTKVASKSSSKNRRTSKYNPYAATATDKIILTFVLLNFMLYPSLITSVLSMFNCMSIGERQFLLADLQEECFTNRHMYNILALGLPQILIYIIGFPLMSILIVGCNQKHVGTPSFKFRYAMLYLGYRDERWWWEIMTVLRKVATVLISVFGILLGPDLQCFLVLAVVFAALFVHLLSKPFDVNTPRHRLLHNMEMWSLCICWLTFWAGLIFFLGKGKIRDELLRSTSVIVVGLNVLALLFMVLIYVKESKVDQKNRVQRMSHLKDVAKLTTSFHSKSSGNLRLWSTADVKSEVKTTEAPELNFSRQSKNEQVSDWL